MSEENTTVQVKESTKRKLDLLKINLKTSFDKIILGLVVLVNKYKMKKELEEIIKNG